MEATGDALRFRQVILNLVGNAIKFTDRGSVTVSVGVERGEDGVEPPPLTGEVMLHVLVTDTGIGIPPDKHRLIFEAFRQVDGSTTRRYGGTGLGLAISARLVELMGGRIWVESEVERGSAFHFTIRCSSANHQRAGLRERDSDQVSSGHSNGRLRVLLAEDNLVNRRLVTALLEKQGHEVVCVGNGREAVSAALSQPLDLVLMDVQMPVMDGLEAAAAIRKSEQGRYLPIVALTAHAMKGDQERCLQAGMDDYLSKPVSTGCLCAVIERWVHRSAIGSGT